MTTLASRIGRWCAPRNLALGTLSALLSACGGGSDVGATQVPPSSDPPVVVISGAPVKTTVLQSGLSAPWGMAFLPDGRMLITQKGGTMVIASADGRSLSAPFGTGLPNLATSGQGGLLDVTLDPDFDANSNPRIYWTFSETGSGGSGTAVARGNLTNQSIVGAEVIYRQTPKVGGDGHFGSRLVFRSDKTLYVTLGDRQRDDPANPGTNNAQNLATTLGKVIRINRDGSAAAGNPSFGAAGARPEVWSYGHRNPQGAALLPGSDELWLTEHGPLGGDELNQVLPGRNYGWPLRSYGCPYSAGSNSVGCRPGGGVHAPEFEEPKATWLPVSTAPSGLLFYSGSRFDDLGWRGNAFAGALAGTTLWRIVLSGTNVVSKEEVAAVKTLGQRIRVVKQGSDGWIYLLTDNGQLLRLER